MNGAVRGAWIAALLVCCQAACCWAEDSPPLAEIKTFEELAAVKPVRVAGEWDVRLGLSDSSPDGGPWKLLWCLAEHSGKETPALRGLPDGIDGSEQLGPVLVRVTQPDLLNAERLEKLHTLSTRHVREAKKALFVKDVLVSAKGKYQVDVFIHDGAVEKVIAARTIDIDVPRDSYWHEFGERREDAEGEPRWVMLATPMAAKPNFVGLEPVVIFNRLSDLQTDDRHADGKRALRLPEFLPGDNRWNELVACDSAEAVKEEDAASPLKLELHGGKLTIRSTCGMVAWADQHFLARWWVKGEPIVAKDTGDDSGVSISRQLAREHEMSVAFVLPETLGKIAVGDRVALQLMYSPAAIERVYSDREFLWLERADHFHNADTLPRLSNRLEFEVTAAMLEGR